MQKLSNYLKEREDMDSIETAYGFAIYKITGNEIYLRDLYVEKQFRQLNHSTLLADKVVEIGLKNGCKVLVGSVAVKAKNPDISIKMLHAYGMSIVSAKDDFLIFKKDIGEE